MPARRIAAGWVLPVGGAPIECGAVLIGHDGRVAAVGPDAAVPRPEDVPAEAFADAIVLPGLINTHTHLELTGLEGRVADREFPVWIRRLRALKAERGRDEFLEAAKRGVEACWAAGVTTVADTGDSGAVIEALCEAGGSGIVYQEVFGPHPDGAEASLAGLQVRVRELRQVAGTRELGRLAAARVDEAGRFAGGRVRLGVSPHAPYTVSGRLYRAVGEWARVEGLPLAVHLAESRAETELLATGSGAFADAWRARGIPLPSPLGRTPVAWLEEHGVLGPDTLCIHVVQVDAADITRLAAAGASIAHCPLSNRAHGHGDAPLAALLGAGLRVGVGTDSVVSVGTLDLLAEARAARALAQFGADAALELCTLAAARALGLDTEIGSLAPGKWGDCVVIRPRAVATGSPEERVLSTGPSDVLTTYLAGRKVYARGEGAPPLHHDFHGDAEVYPKQ